MVIDASVDALARCVPRAIGLLEALDTEFVVISGWRAQWYRNVLAEPRVWVTRGSAYGRLRFWMRRSGFYEPFSTVQARSKKAAQPRSASATHS